MAMDNIVKLISSDNEIFEVDELVVHKSQTLMDTIENVGTKNPIPLPEVSSKILDKVMTYCRYHTESKKSADEKPPGSREEAQQWDEEFIKVDLETLLALYKAADYLNIHNLLMLACGRVADFIKNCKTAEEIRKTFKIQNDFSQEEKERILKENQWTSE